MNKLKLTSFSQIKYHHDTNTNSANINKITASNPHISALFSASPIQRSNSFLFNLDNSNKDDKNTEQKDIQSSTSSNIIKTKMNDQLLSNSFNSLVSSSSSSSGVSSSSSSPASKTNSQTLPNQNSLSVKSLAKSFESCILPNYTKPKIKTSVNPIIKIINHPPLDHSTSSTLQSPSLVKRPKLRSCIDVIAEHRKLEKVELIEQIDTNNKTQTKNSEGSIVSKIFTNSDNPNSNNENIKVIIAKNFHNSDKIVNSISQTDEPLIVTNFNTKKKSNASSSFHRALNRLVESTSKVSSKNKTSNDPDDNQKFELINGYDDSYMPALKTDNGKKRSLSYKTIESKLGKKATYSISNSLPSRNFKSLLDLFKTNTIKSNLSSSSCTYNVKSLNNTSSKENSPKTQEEIKHPDTTVENEKEQKSNKLSEIKEDQKEEKPSSVNSELVDHTKANFENISNLFKNLNFNESQEINKNLEKSTIESGANNAQNKLKSSHSFNGNINLTTFRTGLKKAYLKILNQENQALK